MRYERTVRYALPFELVDANVYKNINCLFLEIHRYPISKTEDGRHVYFSDRLRKVSDGSLEKFGSAMSGTVVGFLYIHEGGEGSAVARVYNPKKTGRKRTLVSISATENYSLRAEEVFENLDDLLHMRCATCGKESKKIYKASAFCDWHLKNAQEIDELNGMYSILGKISKL